VKIRQIVEKNLQNSFEKICKIIMNEKNLQNSVESAANANIH
jgi:hypothetical protein